MRYSIMGFNQQLAVENNLSINDLILLDYIMYANGVPTMSHIVEDEISYVWLNHDKLREDLPILDYSESTLKNKLSNLKSNGFIDSKTISNKGTRGSRTYYTITEKTTYFLKYSNTSSSTVESTSYNQLNNTTNVVYTISKDMVLAADTKQTEFEFGKTEKPKQNLYQKCISTINAFTDDLELRELLVKYLDYCMEIKCIYGHKQWDGMINNTLVKALKQSENSSYNEIVMNALSHGYRTFVKVVNYDNKKPKTKKFEENMIAKPKIPISENEVDWAVDENGNKKVY